MKRKILLSAVFIVLSISCVFAEQYTAQVILNIQDDTKVAWTSEEYNGKKDFVPISEPVELEGNGNIFTSGDAKIYASGRFMRLETIPILQELTIKLASAEILRE